MILRNLVIFLPHLVIAAFILAAWRRHFIYGIYITQLDMLFLTAAMILSIIRVNSTRILSDVADSH
jgi:hypothetical protein